MFSAQSSGAISFSCLVANTFLEFEGDRSPSLGCASQVIYLCFRTELVHPSPTFFSPFFLTAAHKYIIPAHYSYSISMGIILFICVLFYLDGPILFRYRSVYVLVSRVGIGCQPVCQRALLSRYVCSYLPCQAHCAKHSP